MKTCRSTLTSTAAAAVLLAVLPPARAVDAGASKASPGRHGVAISVVMSTDDMDVYEYDNRGDTEQATLDRHFIELRYGLADQIDLIARYGEMAWDPHSPNGGEYDYGDAWGVGVAWRFAALEEYDLTFGCAFNYNHGDPQDRPRPGRVTFEGEIEEWQLSVETAYTWRNLAVFGGVRYQQVDLVYRHASNHEVDRQGGLEEVDSLGLFAGADWTIWRGLSLSGEVRLLSSTGGTITLGYGF